MYTLYKGSGGVGGREAVRSRLSNLPRKIRVTPTYASSADECTCTTCPYGSGRA